ncbi:MAG: hypothetical protein FWD36_05715 [Treponema sp.]|nr:hypothetical protein [Treponema sp.]
MKTLRRIKLRKNKGLLGEKSLAEHIIPRAAPRLATILTNLITIGPRIILRSAFQLFRTNIWTRLISTLALVSFDIYNFAKKKISLKQLIVNMILSVTMLFSGMAGWIFGKNSIPATLAENTIIWVLAGIAGAGAASAVSVTVCRKLLGRILKSDVEDMLEFINNEFELMAQEQWLSDEQIDELAGRIKIDSKICVICFSKSDKKKYARELLQPYFTIL